MDRRNIGHAIRFACVLMAYGELASAQQVGGQSKSQPARPTVQGFSVVLVLGDLAGTAAAPDNVPVAARKALADMKDFLPYKSYRLLDTAWFLNRSDSASSTGRIRGDDREYELTLGAVAEASDASSRTLRVTFQLKDLTLGQASAVSESATPSLDHLRATMERAEAQKMSEAQAALLNARRMAIEVELRALRERFNESHPDVINKKRELDNLTQLGAASRNDLGDRLQELRAFENRFSAARGRITTVPIRTVQPSKIIDTGFTMDIGETVVVGTSRVRGERAIIALLTAVPREAKK